MLDLISFYDTVYDTNADFKLYVDRYCQTYKLDKETALQHELVRLTAEYYKENESIIRI